VAEIDQQRDTQSVGLALSTLIPLVVFGNNVGHIIDAALELSTPIRLVVFGKAAMGTLLMLCNQIAGLDLPLNVLVYSHACPPG
jgi:uncharacterized protein (DUF302 family)